MPKMKTHRASAKRFRLTGTGKVRFNSAYRRHRLVSKEKSAKERNQGTKIMFEGEARNIRTYRLPNDNKVRRVARVKARQNQMPVIEVASTPSAED